MISLKKLNTSFITPFDREDIYSLAASLDNVMDTIDTATQHIIVYHINSITPEAKELGFIILKSCQTLERALMVLEKYPNKFLIFALKLTP